MKYSATQSHNFRPTYPKEEEQRPSYQKLEMAKFSYHYSKSPELKQSMANRLNQLKTTKIPSLSPSHRRIDDYYQTPRSLLVPASSKIPTYQAYQRVVLPAASSKAKFCTNCGSGFVDAAKFCGDCGRKRWGAMGWGRRLDIRIRKLLVNQNSYGIKILGFVI